MNLIKKHNQRILDLCKAHKVKSLYVFGSILNENFNKESDIDFIVSFENIELLEYGDNYYDLKFSLENTFNRSVELLEEKEIKNPYFRNSNDKTKVLIYG